MEFASNKLAECKQSCRQDVSLLTETLIDNLSTEDSNTFKWPYEAILFLIEEYRKKSYDIYSDRVSQKKIWQLISDELVKKKYNVTGPQCHSKFSGLKRTYKSIKDHNGKSGNGSRLWFYFDLLEGLIGSKPYMSPLATASSSGKRDEAELNSLLCLNEDHPKKKPNHTAPVDKVLSAIEVNRKLTEESKERRHKKKWNKKRKSLVS